MADSAWLAGIQRARQERDDSLRAEDGWLTLVGLTWLRPGDNSFGSGTGNDVVVSDPAAPAHGGTLRLEEDGRVRLIEADLDMELADDETEGGPTLFEAGRVRLHVVRRAGRVGIRMRDAASPVRLEFTGVEAFAPDERWRVRAQVERYPTPKPVLVPTILGDLEPDQVGAALTFEVDGRALRLDLFEAPDGSFEGAFSDLTNGHETYGAGRFIDTRPPQPDGSVELDFNLAYNPPCVFTAFATCPLPLAQNHLPIRVEAGERAMRH
jgi:uncharacterized protein